MNGQMKLFEYFGAPDLSEMTEEEAVKMVGDRIGMAFTYNSRFERWEAKNGKLKLDMNYDHYDLPDSNALFLGVGYTLGTSGGGAPCHSIDEAVNWFEYRIEKARAECF